MKTWFGTSTKGFAETTSNFTSIRAIRIRTPEDGGIGIRRQAESRTGKARSLGRHLKSANEPTSKERIKVGAEKRSVGTEP